MKEIFTREFWNTPILDMSVKDRGRALLLFFALFMICVVIGGIAAWHIVY